MDGYLFYISLEIFQLVKENEIEIFCLLFYIISEFQFLDKCVFKLLKIEYNKVCMQFLKENLGWIVIRYDFCGLFMIVYYKVCMMFNVVSVFCVIGIFFFNFLIIFEEVFGLFIVFYLLS